MPFGAFFLSMKNRYLVFYGVFFLVALFYAFVNPFNNSSHMPGCFIYQNTGIFCPGCGLQRALHAFFTGDFMLAFSMNPLVFLALIILCIDFLFLLLKWERYRPVPPMVNSHAALLTIAIILFLFMVLRNVNSEYLEFLKPMG
jgi:hypothetical protein